MCSCNQLYDYARDAYIITREYIFARSVTLNSKLPTTIVANLLISRTDTNYFRLLIGTKHYRQCAITRQWHISIQYNTNFIIKTSVSQYDFFFQIELIDWRTYESEHRGFYLIQEPKTL